VTRQAHKSKKRPKQKQVRRNALAEHTEARSSRLVTVREKLTLRQLRKIRTRRMILRAGRELFANRGVELPRVEDVARTAGLSRATFYLHFQSLDELIKAVFERELRFQLRRYNGLTAEILKSERKVRGWMERLVSGFRSEKNYILVNYRALSSNPEYLKLMFRERARMLERVGRRVSQLRIITADGSIDSHRLLGLLFLSGQLEDLSLYSAFDAWDADLNDSFDMLARRLVEFAR
jgi:AcrR family transcriptional regulator